MSETGSDSLKKDADLLFLPKETFLRYLYTLSIDACAYWDLVLTEPKYRCPCRRQESSWGSLWVQGKLGHYRSKGRGDVFRGVSFQLKAEDVGHGQITYAIPSRDACLSSFGCQYWPV